LNNLNTDENKDNQAEPSRQQAQGNNIAQATDGSSAIVNAPTTNIVNNFGFLLFVPMLLVALGAAVYFALPRAIPQMNEGIVRVAFPTLDPGDPPPDLTREEREKRTQALVFNLEQVVEPKLQQANIPFSIWGPDSLNSIDIPTEDPHLFAQQVNANIVVDGAIGESRQEGRLALFLHVADATNVDAGELLGSYYLGEPIPYTPPFYGIEAQRESMEMVQDRVEMLTNVMLAIADLLSPRNTADLDRAQRHLDAAYTLIQETGTSQPVVPTGCPPGYNPPDLALSAVDARSEATILVLKGNAAARAEDFDTAIEHYESATVLACDYARPYLGIAATLTRRAIIESPTRSLLVDDQEAQRQYSETLSRAEEYFAWAQQASWRPDNALFTERITYGRAEWHLGLTRLPSEDAARHYAAARELYTNLINDYETGSADKRRLAFLRELIASAYSSRASTEIGTANYPEALRDLESAVERTVNADRQAKWLLMQSHLYFVEHDCINAQQKIQEAEEAVEEAQRAHLEVQGLAQEIEDFALRLDEEFIPCQVISGYSQPGDAS
jgi:tetratricopeptide (TPR) repeat protein